MHEAGPTLITLGGLLLAGLAAEFIGRRTRLPRVTLLLLLGVLAGPVGFNLLPSFSREWFPLVADMTLVMVGFLIGGRLSVAGLRDYGWQIVAISLGVALVTLALVGGGLLLVGAPLMAALVLGVVASATDPVATEAVVKETGAKGRFTEVLLGVVALDDAWGLLLFSLVLIVVELAAASGGLSAGPFLWELGGAVLIGVGLGLPTALLTGRIRPGEPTLLEALGTVLLCGGLALWLDASFLLAAMLLGATVANLAHHHDRPFYAIEDIEWPFMIVFFVLAGAMLEPGELAKIGVVGLAYVVLRVAARFLGAWLGGWLSGYRHRDGLIMGSALLPQAGVAIGVALVAAEHDPSIKDWVLPVAIGVTVIFELVGPILTRLALERTANTG